MTSSRTPGSATSTDAAAQEPVEPRVLSALKRFRVAAVVTGFGLLVLVAVMLVRYVWDNPTPSQIWSPIHGALYMIYLVLAVDLGIKARWSVTGVLLVLLAGCVPFVSFVAERKVTHRTMAGRSI